MIGRTISHYTIDSKLGSGGMGVVYKATDLRLGRAVALKFLPPEMTRAENAKQRFIQEAQTASSLDHPNICTIYEFDETAEHQLFFAMAYYEGQTLKERLAEGPLSVDEALKMARQVARGLAKAHQRGIIHRDIKPANLMITNESEIKILDFGLAKLGADRSLTREGTTVGSPPYMSPEQIRGEPVDHRTDIWSLGVVLYEMVRGRAPFRGENDRAIFHSILEQEVEPTGQPAIDRVLRKALAKAVQDRYRDLTELLNDLDLATAASSMTQLKATVESSIPSIAVLPFADMSPGRDQEYFCEGIAEEILNSLTHIEGLRVAARTSSFQFKGAAQDIRGIGEQLRVTTVLEGSVRKAGERLRVTVQLIKVADGYHLWSERYDGDVHDVFQIQDQIAEKTARALEPLLGQKKPMAQAQRTQIDAYDFYLRGRKFYNELRRRSMELAREMFERAAAIDPNYALAYTGIADASSWMVMWFGGAETDLKKAEQASRRAIELAPDLAEAHVSRGLPLFLARNYDHAVKEFERAIELNPNLFDAWYLYGRARFSQGRFEEAAKLFLKAGEVRPEDYQSFSIAAMAFRKLGWNEQYAMAAEESLKRIEQRLKIDPRDTRAIYLGANQMLMYRMEPQRAEEMLEQSLAIDPEDVVVRYNAACFYALAGKPEKALEMLEKATSNQEGLSMKDWIANDPDLDSIRNVPRFQEIVSRLR